MSLDSYSVYNRQNKKKIAEGTFCKIQHYLGNKNHYQVVWDFNGDELTDYHYYWMFK